MPKKTILPLGIQFYFCRKGTRYKAPESVLSKFSGEKLQENEILIFQQRRGEPEEPEEIRAVQCWFCAPKLWIFSAF